MTDNELEAFIESVSVRGSVYGLDSIKRLLEKTGNPQDGLKFIHIAGTNGKGSILAYISEILKCAGYKTGRYISPVIGDYREKIQINGRMISRKDLREGMERIKDACDEISKEYPCPTLFEVETALAFSYFKSNACDIVVLETGMGGLNDATNVIKTPVLNVFATISMDHMAILGNTVREIALQKAGIIKPNTPVVSAIQTPEASEVLCEAARHNNTDVTFSLKPRNVRYSMEKTIFSYGNLKDLEIGLLGEYQPENAAVALEAVYKLTQQGYDISEKSIRKGLKNTVWKGRFTVVSRRPLFIMDGAHNEDAARRLRESVVRYLKNKPLIFIIGVLKDKEYDAILHHMLDLASFVITLTPPDNPRALPAMDLAEAARKYHQNVTTADSVEEAVEMAMVLAGEDKPKCAIVAFGSLSYLDRLQKTVENKNKKYHI